MWETALSSELEQHVLANQARLTRIAKQYARGDEWQDLFQEMLVTIWLGLPSFKGRSSIDTWLYRVASNTALSFARKRQVDWTPMPFEKQSSHGDETLEALLSRFLQSLDPINRALLMMDLDGLDREAIAEVLGISAGAVAVRMTRLRARFQADFME